MELTIWLLINNIKLPLWTFKISYFFMKLHRMFDIIHTFTFYLKAEKYTFSCTNPSKIQKSIGFLPNYKRRGTLSDI